MLLVLFVVVAATTAAADVCLLLFVCCCCAYIRVFTIIFLLSGAPWMSRCSLLSFYSDPLNSQYGFVISRLSLLEDWDSGLYQGG